MIKTYTLEDPKPDFKYGDAVKVDMAHLGASDFRIDGKGHGQMVSACH